MTTKQRRKSLVTSKFNLGLIGILAVLVIIQLAFNTFVWRHAINRDDGRIASLILDATDNLGSPVPVEAQTGKFYIAAERLMLPSLPADEQRLTYVYNPAGGGSPAEIMFTTRGLTAQSRNDINNAASSNLPAREKTEKIFGFVPELQACSRGVHVVFGEPEDTSHLTDAGTKTLADGRSIRFYTEVGCSVDQEALLTYLKRIESY